MLYQYAYARKYAELNDLHLLTPDWPGQKVFELPPSVRAGSSWKTLAGYFQKQEDMIYSRADCRRWFKLRPELRDALDRAIINHRPCFHVRRGDYVGKDSCYPTIALEAYWEATKEYGFDSDDFTVVSDEHPMVVPGFEGDLAFFPDFYRLMVAPVLFRANSTFSWWAHVLGAGRVFSPVVVGLKGGHEYRSIRFIEGNWPRCADLDCVDDLTLKEA